MSSPVVNPFDTPTASVVDPGGLLAELDAPSTPTVEPAAAVEEAVKKGDILVDQLSPEETSYLRTIIRRSMQVEHETEVATAFLAKHTLDYKPTPQNFQIIQQILHDSNNAPFTPENVEAAFQAALANNLLDMPTPGSVSEAYRQDVVRIGAQQSEAARLESQRQAELATRPTIRTGLPNMTQETPVGEEESMGDFAEKISRLPIDQARVVMERAMLAARQAGGSLSVRDRELFARGR